MRPIHLTRRGAVYAVRFRLPIDLASRLAMTELRKSLHTSDIALARKRCLQATVWFRAEVERLRRMATPTRTDLEEAARTYFAALARELDQPRPFDPDYLELDVAMNVEASCKDMADLEIELKANAFGGGVRLAAADMLAGIGIDPESLDPKTQVVAYQLAARAIRAQLQLFVHQLQNPAGEFVMPDPVFRDAPKDPALILPLTAAPSRSMMPGAGLGAAMKDYLAKKSLAVGQSQHDEIARALKWLGETVGTETPLSSIAKERLRGFRDDLARIDVTLRGRDMPFAQRMTNVPERQIRSVTSARYWKSVQAFFAWCEAEGLRQDDPSTGLKIVAKKGEKPHSPEPFSQEELRKLFRTPLYAGYASPRDLDEPGQCFIREGHWWSGVLALHTGMRAGEFSQLLPSDFRFDDDVPHVKVREVDDEGARVKRTKTEASTRDIPIHPNLIVLGLRSFVEGSGKKYPKGRVFRVFGLGQGDRTSDGATRFWRAHLKTYGLHKLGRATHVFRHTIAHHLRAAGAAGEDIGAILGHAGRTQTDGYGGAQTLARKAKTLAMLDFGFDVVAALGGPFDPERHA